jgi:hypothetical protein
MTRRHAALQLLRLEPIRFIDFVEVTGWKCRACQYVLNNLQTRGQAKQIKRGVWVAA